MGRLRDWLVRTYLPAWATQELLEENKRLREKLARCRAEYDALRCYADGLEFGLQAMRNIRVEVVQKGGENDADAHGTGADG